MLIVQITEATGFSHTAKFAGVYLNQYNLQNKEAVCQIFLYEDDGFGVPVANSFLDMRVALSSTDTAGWLGNDLNLVDVVLAKKGLTRVVT